MKYRKKPVVVDAVQITTSFLREMRGPLGSHLTMVSGDVEYYKDHVEIQTLEGKMRGNLLDWIITGVNGEKYPCKPDIFEKTYEVATEQPQEEKKQTMRELLDDPKAFGKVLAKAAHGGAFMQDFKMQIWGAMTYGNRISESQLDEIAQRLYEKWVKKPQIVEVDGTGSEQKR